MGFAKGQTGSTLCKDKEMQIANENYINKMNDKISKTCDTCLTTAKMAHPRKLMNERQAILFPHETVLRMQIMDRCVCVCVCMCVHVYVSLVSSLTWSNAATAVVLVWS